jgi:Fe-S-cluster containining protein
MKVPWRKVHSWHCTACGLCCNEYIVPLRSYEYLKLRWSGFVEERLGRFYIKKVNGKCPFQHGRLCILQGELKPIACKLYPFVIRKKGDESAEFEYNGETFYVYVDTFCPNIVLGRPSESLKRMIVEAIQVNLGEKNVVENITCRKIFSVGGKAIV